MQVGVFLLLLLTVITNLPVAALGMVGDAVGTSDVVGTADDVVGKAGVEVHVDVEGVPDAV